MPDSSRLRAIQRALIAWASTHTRSFPWRRRGVSPYEVLLAEVLLKRTTAKAAASVFGQLLSRFPDLPSLATADERDLKDIFRQVGLQRQRTRAVREMSGFLIREHRGTLPPDLRQLLRVPHVGPYTAAAVLCLAYGIRIPMVDSNADRVLRRLFARTLSGQPVSRVWKSAESVLPQVRYREFNLAVLDLAASVCIPRFPRCPSCPLVHDCDYASSKGLKAKVSRTPGTGQSSSPGRGRS